MLRDQGLSKKNMDSVFHALILCKIRYALCAWCGHITEANKGQINAFLRRMHRYGYVSAVYSLILTTWYVLLMLNCFRRCVKCIIALIIFCLMWKRPIIHCVKGITSPFRITFLALQFIEELICHSLSFQIQVNIFLLLTVVMSFCPCTFVMY